MSDRYAMSDRDAPSLRPQPHSMMTHHEPPTILNPMSREEIDEWGEQMVGRWESAPTFACVGGCIPINVEVKFNVYGPANDGAPIVGEMESTGDCCFCCPIHQVGLRQWNPENMINTEKTLGPPSRELAFFVTVDRARDAEGTLVVTQRGTGVEEGRPMTVTEEWRFSRVRDATMTWKQHTPNRIAVEFRKVSKAPAPLSEQFLTKMQVLRQYL